MIRHLEEALSGNQSIAYDVVPMPAAAKAAGAAAAAAHSAMRCADEVAPVDPKVFEGSLSSGQDAWAAVCKRWKEQAKTSGQGDPTELATWLAGALRNGHTTSLNGVKLLFGPTSLNKKERAAKQGLDTLLTKHPHWTPIVAKMRQRFPSATYAGLLEALCESDATDEKWMEKQMAGILEISFKEAAEAKQLPKACGGADGD